MCNLICWLNITHELEVWGFQFWVSSLGNIQPEIFLGGISVACSKESPLWHSNLNDMSLIEPDRRSLTISVIVSLHCQLGGIRVVEMQVSHVYEVVSEDGKLSLSVGRAIPTFVLDWLKRIGKDVSWATEYILFYFLTVYTVWAAVPCPTLLLPRFAWCGGLDPLKLWAKMNHSFLKLLLSYQREE